MPLPKKLAIAVTFFYVESRLTYLRRISRHFSSLADIVEIYLVTNARDAERKRKISDIFSNYDLTCRIVVPHLLGHPYLLTWTHLEVFRQIFNDTSISHFMYVEDDTLVRAENVNYWMEGREVLRNSGFYPSFFRYELRNDEGPAYSSDCTGPADGRALPYVAQSSDYCFVNLPWPYQGMYLMDREMMLEHLSGESSSPDFGRWLIREKAAQGLTFKNVPEGFWSRNLVGYRLDKGRLDEFCLVHHTPNSYVEKEGTALGKTLISKIIDPRIPPLH